MWCSALIICNWRLNIFIRLDLETKAKAEQVCIVENGQLVKREEVLQDQQRAIQTIQADLRDFEGTIIIIDDDGDDHEITYKRKTSETITIEDDAIQQQISGHGGIGMTI